MSALPLPDSGSAGTLVLWHWPLCPFSRKVRLCLEEKKLPFEARLEKPWEYREEFVHMNPAGTVPVLKHGENVVVESAVIVEYLDDIWPASPALLGQNRPDRNEIRRLEFWFDGKFYTEVTRCLVYQKIFRRFFEQTGPDSAVMRQGMEALQTHMAYIEFLVEQRNWLAGDHLSVADFAAAAHLSALDWLGDVPWENFPEARIWYARLKSRPCFRPLLADTVTGLRPAAHYTLLDF